MRGSIRRVLLRNISIVALVLSVGATVSSATVRGQSIYVGNGGSHTVGEYTASGEVVNASLISDSLAVCHCRVWIELVCREFSRRHGWRIHHIRRSRERLADLGVRLSVCHCRVWIEPVCRESRRWHDWRIHHVRRSRERLADIGVGGYPDGIAVSGSNLFVAIGSSSGSDWIGEYTTSGGMVNASLISGFGSYTPIGIAVSGSNLFVANKLARLANTLRQEER